MTLDRHAALGAAFLFALVLPGLGSSAWAGETRQVVIKAFAFGPKEVTVEAGTTVTWTNRDPEPHTVVSKDGKFRSAALDTGDGFSFTFTVPGHYEYFCSLHPHMVGVVDVTPKP
jgi:plastocyanin